MARLDVRPILAAGGEPFEEIMETVASLTDSEGLELIAPLEPVPLYQVLGAMGFAHETRSLGGGEYEVVFRRLQPSSPASGADAAG